MKVAIVTEWYSRGMGYAENALPRAFDRQGHEVHIFTSDLQVYGNTGVYAKTYKHLLGPAIQPLGTSTEGGVLLHRLPRTSERGFWLNGLESALNQGNFDLIYGFEVNQELTRQLLAFRRRCAIKLFLESRLHESVFVRKRGRKRIKQLARNWNLGRQLVRNCDKIFPVASDVQKILRREFGIPESMMTIQGLGVDDSIFFADPDDPDAVEIRECLGAGTGETVLVYAGRLTRDKGVDLLMDAYLAVRERRPEVRLLLVGEGELLEQASANRAITVLGFQPQERLSSIYRSADIGVWPRQESTSRFDAAACGLQLIVPRNAGDLQRLPRGTMTFRADDPADLAEAIVRIAVGRPTRTERSSLRGFQIDEDLSWTSIAARIQDHALQNLPHASRSDFNHGKGL